jgi:magnesium chelatase family protein
MEFGGNSSHGCPCGYLTDRKRSCRCSGNAIRKYLNKISGPLLDRIDIHLEIPALKTAELMSTPPGEPSKAIRERIEAARHRQFARLRPEGVFANAQMSHKQTRKFCPLNKKESELLKIAMTELALSARAYDKILKISRTIADLAGCDNIQTEHLSEAMQYRSLDKGW